MSPLPIDARARATCVVALLAACALALFWQWEFGAYRSEFGGHPDEAAHVVTGLFVRDALVEGWKYAAGGFHGSPVRLGREFADRYYTHYPKIGLGVWPPFFYLVRASWTLPFGASRISLLLLLGVLAAILGGMVFRVLRDEFGASLAGVAAAVLLSLPLVRTYYGMVMAETLSAVLMLGAMLAFGAFLDREKRRDAIWFGVLAALAILTKGTGLALGLAAPLALLMTRRFHLLARPALWLSVAIVVVVAGPWTWATRNLGKGGWLQPDPSWSFTREALPYYAGKCAVALGPVLLLFVAIGVLAENRRSVQACGPLGGGGRDDTGRARLSIHRARRPGSKASHSDPAGGAHVCGGGIRFRGAQALRLEVRGIGGGRVVGDGMDCVAAWFGNEGFEWG